MRFMLNIKPVSELRNYKKLLAEVTKEQPVILTKNGYGKYAIVDLEEYDRLQLGLKILNDLKKSEAGPSQPFSEFEKELFK